MSIQSSKIKASNGFIVELDPRVRVLTSCVFAILVALSDRFLSLGVSLSFALLLALIAGVAYRQTCRRFIELNTFILVLFVFLPFSFPGKSLFSLGGFVWSLEGMLRALKIVLKANAIMLVFAALIATMEPTQLGLALSRLRCPNKLSSLFFLTVRYFDVIHQEYLRLRNAMKLRCFRSGFNLHTFKTYGYLVGMLLVKSLDRSERILEAMKCRGFRDRFYTLTTLTFTTNDILFVVVSGCIIISLGCLEWL